jgi:arylsulfatase
MDPYERADQTSDNYFAWLVDNDFLVGQGSFHAIEFLETFKAYPPSQLPASFSPDGVEAEIDALNKQHLRVNAPGSGMNN